MKKILSLVSAAIVATAISCGPSAEEKAAAEKYRQDSINDVMAQRAADSLLQVTMEKNRQDSIDMAMRADSIAQAEAAAGAKKKSSTPKKQTSTKPDTRSETTKEADKKVESAFDKFKKKSN